MLTDGGCACGGAAVACSCNPEAVYDGWVKVYASVEPEKVKEWVQ
jgi:hypothetical protein